MKVLMVAPSYPSKYCGIATYTDYLCQELGRLVDISVLGKGTFHHKAFRLRDFTDAIKDQDIIHLQHAISLYGYMGIDTFWLLFLLNFYGKRIVVSLHELPSPKNTFKDKVARLYLRFCYKTILKRSQKVIVHNEYSYKVLSNLGNKNNLCLIPHGSIRQLRIESSNTLHKTIGFLGFITENKGIHQLIRIMATLQDVNCIIAGSAKTEQDQRYLQKLKAMVEDLGLTSRVAFRGYVDDDQVASFLNSIDVLVLPYLQVTASGILHIALAHKCVVLASDLPAFTEIEERYGCLATFDRLSDENFREKIQLLLSSQERRNALISAAESMLSATAWQEVAFRTYRLYDEMVQGQ